MLHQKGSASGDSPLGLIGFRHLEIGNKNSKGEGKGAEA